MAKNRAGAGNGPGRPSGRGPNYRRPGGGGGGTGGNTGGSKHRGGSTSSGSSGKTNGVVLWIAVGLIGVPFLAIASTIGYVIFGS